jgi:sulfatase maturation enzyme AslB (radical SAM superfamily)
MREARRKFDSLPRYCREYRHLFACDGESPKNRLVCTPDGEPGLNYLCGGVKRFWTHIERDICPTCCAASSITASSSPRGHLILGAETRSSRSY